ncbi:hypothetical protein HanLR1_Chr09g0297361 [Helianthus annuus]|nr:hypothetical protein HanLR1_Chr09g0297361 [Helianthus annuus]
MLSWDLWYWYITLVERTTQGLSCKWVEKSFTFYMENLLSGTLLVPFLNHVKLYPLPGLGGRGWVLFIFCCLDGKGGLIWAGYMSDFVLLDLWMRFITWASRRTGSGFIRTCCWDGLSLVWAGVIRGRLVEPSSSYSGCSWMYCFLPPLSWTIGSVLSQFPPLHTRIVYRRYLVVLGLVCVLGINTYLGDIRQDWFGRLSFRWLPNLHPTPKPKPVGFRNCVCLIRCSVVCRFGAGDGKGWESINRWNSMQRLYQVLWWLMCIRFTWEILLDLGLLVRTKTKSAVSWLHHLWTQDTRNDHPTIISSKLSAQYQLCSLLKTAAVSWLMHMYGIGWLWLVVDNFWGSCNIMTITQTSVCRWGYCSCYQRVVRHGIHHCGFKLMDAYNWIAWCWFLYPRWINASWMICNLQVKFGVHVKFQGNWFCRGIWGKILLVTLTLAIRLWPAVFGTGDLTRCVLGLQVMLWIRYWAHIHRFGCIENRSQHNVCIKFWLYKFLSRHCIKCWQFFRLNFRRAGPAHSIVAVVKASIWVLNPYRPGLQIKAQLGLLLLVRKAHLWVYVDWLLLKLAEAQVWDHTLLCLLEDLGLRFGCLRGWVMRFASELCFWVSWTGNGSPVFGARACSYRALVSKTQRWIRWILTGSGRRPVVLLKTATCMVYWAAIIDNSVGLEKWIRWILTGLKGRRYLGPSGLRYPKSQAGLKSLWQNRMNWLTGGILWAIAVQKARCSLPYVNRQFCKGFSQRWLGYIVSVLSNNTRYFCTPKCGRMISYFWSPRFVSGIIRGYAPLKL